MTAPKHNAQQQSGGFRPGCFGVLLLLALTVIIPYVAGLRILQPHVTLPAEKVIEEPLFTLPFLGEQGKIYLTNSLIAWLLAVIIVFWISIKAGRAVKRAMAEDNYVLTGFTDAFVSFIEVLYNLTEATAGKWTRTIFPYFATITVLVLVVNWMELLPGMDTIGLVVPSHEPYGYVVKFAGPVALLVDEKRKPAKGAEGKAAYEEGMKEEKKAEGGEEGKPKYYEFRPFLRVASTDLNFTIALALVSVIMTQVIGLRALGLHYLEKFFNFRALARGPMGLLDFAVGLLEIISELSKILSFSFRLFGNIFAGSVLLFVMGALAPPILFGFYGLELFVGLIQAFVFGMLTMVFMAQATHHH